MEHAGVNILLPPAVMSQLGHYSLKALEAIAKFLGPKLLPWMATINVFGVATVIAGIERSCCNSEGDPDGKINFPIPGTRAFTKAEAMTLIIFGWAMQTVNAALSVERPDSETSYYLQQLYNSGLFAIIGQISASLLLHKVGSGIGSAYSYFWPVKDVELADMLSETSSLTNN